MVKLSREELNNDFFIQHHYGRGDNNEVKDYVIRERGKRNFLLDHILYSLDEVLENN